MFLGQVEEDLKRVFEIYCSIGDPLNTEKLKSSKAVKLIKDCKILRDKEVTDHLILSEDQISRYKKIVPLSKVQLDLIFTTLTSNPNIGMYDSSKDEMGISKMGNSRSFMNTSIMSSKQAHMMSMDSSTGEPQHHSSKGKMDFEHFVKFIELISKKILPNIP